MLNKAEMNRLSQLYAMIRQGWGLTPEERENKSELEDKATAFQLGRIPMIPKW